MSGGVARVFPELDGAELERLLEWVDTLTAGVDLGEGPFAGPWAAPAPWTDVAAQHADAVAGTIFGQVVAPLVADVLDEVDAAVRRGAAGPGGVGDPARVSLRLRGHLVRQATTLAARHLLHRLDAERRGGRLHGPTPEDRFADFVARTSSAAGLATLVRDLPDVAAWVHHVTRLRADALVEALASTATRWEQIASVVPGVAADDRVVDLDPGAGDTHGGGASVAVLHLASGGRLVTKPRALDVERGFADFTRWFGDRLDVPLPGPATVTAGRRGWAEFVAPGRAGGHPDYLRTSGTLLAALYLLRATDMHYENLVSDARGLPVVIDAESLFTPALEGTDRPAAGLLGVVATGMLSLRRETVAPGEGDDLGALEAGALDPGALDPGALGYRAGGVSPYSSWRAVHPGRDDMRLEMTPVQVDRASPVPADVPRDADAAGVLASAFERAADHALRHRDAVADAIEQHFPRGDVRYIHRPTMSYAQVLRMATHPAFATRRDRHRALARLAVLRPSAPPALLASEVLQMTRADLPSFSVPLRGTTVRDGRGDRTGARAAAAPLPLCVAAVRSLQAGDVEREADQVRGSLAAW